jgi:hypothetical protein
MSLKLRLGDIINIFLYQFYFQLKWKFSIFSV